MRLLLCPPVKTAPTAATAEAAGSGTESSPDPPLELAMLKCLSASIPTMIFSRRKFAPYSKPRKKKEEEKKKKKMMMMMMMTKKKKKKKKKKKD